MAKQRIAFIGLGGMGAGMACRLAESGYEIAVYNRTASKADEAVSLGARLASSPADAATEADVVMLSLANHEVVSGMLHGDDGVFGALKPGAYICDMSTVPPSFAQSLSADAAAAGFHALDTCVYGAPFHARSGDLRVMAGGDEADFEAVADVLGTIGKQVTYLGASGMGAYMKLVLNMLMGVQMPAMAEAIVFGEKAGLSRDKILEMINGTGYSSPVMNLRCGIIGRRDFEKSLFKLELMRKDMKLVSSEAARMGVPMPVTESAHQMLTAAMQQGLGDLDVGAVIAFQERLSGMTGYDWPAAE
ncbi:MAG TPA: NAD(P)-dependent oxidoreductase [Acidimicrobiales bacterium]|nr:NAD(P)-dependent oxidoreductase [Acidimicrobiales bacterium]